MKATLLYRLVWCCIPLLSACSLLTQNPALLTASKILAHDEQVESSKLDPRFHYLRVVLSNRVVILASATPNIDVPGAVTVWYSAEREVLRFRDGRLLAAVGLETEWREVRIPALPKWSELAQNSQPFKWARMRDVMPGYRYNLRDELILQRISIPADSQLKVLDPSSLIWFEERLVHGDGGDGMPPTRYAVDVSNGNEKVVYGEQCISKELCFSWQQWPVSEKDRPQ